MEDSRRLSELLLEQSPSCQWMVSADGVFQRVHGDAAPVFGKPAAELTGRPFSQILDRQIADSWSERFARAFEGKSMTLRQRHCDGIWNITVFPIRVEGEIRYAGGLAREGTPWNSAEWELRRIVLSALKAQESERFRTARFLHDTIGQDLTALGFQLDLVRLDLERLSPETCARVSEVQRLLEGVMEDVRKFSYELKPSTVERVGLRPALNELIARLRTRFRGALRVNMEASLKQDPKIASAMYQIAQAALENSVQHAGCSEIEIAVKSTRTGTVLEIIDNGRGFDPAGPLEGPHGLGLLTMEYCAAQAGLELSITSNGKSGTRVRAAAQEG